MINRSAIAVLCAALVLPLAACNKGQDQSRPTDMESESATPSPSVTPASVLREDIAPSVKPEPAREPFEATVPFAGGGDALSDAARAAIEGIVASENFARGGRITLRGHTDSVGNDEANLKASETRARAVADALVAAGAEEDRIEVIPIGEMRPVAPNAHLDGSPDEEGRARNRRVDVHIAPPPIAEPKPDAKVSVPPEAD